MGAPADETPTTYLADYVPFPYDVEKVRRVRVAGAERTNERTNVRRRI
jgi:hypothetical protein